ncbi:MAG: hypothetical protein BECKG1743D_GA0114223_109253, partial [Candidatus Kentron sp. G]
MSAKAYPSYEVSDSAPESSEMSATPQQQRSWYDERFTLQAIIELQKTTGYLTSAVESLKDAVESSNRNMEKRFEASEKRFESLQNTMDRRFESLQNAIEKQNEHQNKRMTALEGKVSELSKKIYAAGVILTILVGIGVTARVISGVASHIQVEETEALHVSRIALMVRGYLRSECVK